MVATDTRAGETAEDPKAVRLKAIERRRFARLTKKKRLAALDSASTETVIRARMSAVVSRMVRRFVPPELRSEPLFNRYDFWSLRRFGYDVMSADLRWTGARDDNGFRILYPPELSPAWLWWTRGLHWRTRLKMSGGSYYILKGLCPAQEQNAYNIQNPRIEIERKPIHDFTQSDFSNLDEC